MGFVQHNPVPAFVYAADYFLYDSRRRTISTLRGIYKYNNENTKRERQGEREGETERVRNPSMSDWKWVIKTRMRLERTFFLKSDNRKRLIKQTYKYYSYSDNETHVMNYRPINILRLFPPQEKICYLHIFLISSLSL